MSTRISTKHLNGQTFDNSADFAVALRENWAGAIDWFDRIDDFEDLLSGDPTIDWRIKRMFPCVYKEGGVCFLIAAYAPELTPFVYDGLVLTEESLHDRFVKNVDGDRELAVALFADEILHVAGKFGRDDKLIEINAVWREHVRSFFETKIRAWSHPDYGRLISQEEMEPFVGGCDTWILENCPYGELTDEILNKIFTLHKNELLCGVLSKRKEPSEKPEHSYYEDLLVPAKRRQWFRDLGNPATENSGGLNAMLSLSGLANFELAIAERKAAEEA